MPQGGLSNTTIKEVCALGGSFRFVGEPNGNVVLYAGETEVVWSSNTGSAANGPSRLILQADGNLVMYNSKGKAIWATNTNKGNGEYYLSVRSSGVCSLFDINNNELWATA